MSGQINSRFVRGLAMAALVAIAPGVHSQVLSVPPSARAQTLNAKLTSTGIVGGILALDAVDVNDLQSRFAAFRPHAFDRSNFDARPQSGSVADDSQRLPESLASVIRASFVSTPDHQDKAALRTNFLSQLSHVRQWSLLDALETHREFKAAFGLSEAMIEHADSSDANNMDMLHLIAARNGFFAYYGKLPASYAAHLARAAGSSNEEIARQARLWSEAVTRPVSVEGMDLAYQVWRCLHIDASNDDSAWTVASQIASQSPAIFDSVAKSAAAQGEKAITEGRILATAAHMAVQANNPRILRWAIDTARGVVGATPDQAMLPEYYGAFMYYGTEHYAEAINGFELLFLSGTPCDTAAQAGVMMAECDTLQNDYVGAKVVLDIVEELYPNQPQILAKARLLKSKVMHVVPELDPKIAEAYRKQHFESRLAELQKERSPSVAPSLQQASAAPLQINF